jgi:hypothetical protein
MDFSVLSSDFRTQLEQQRDRLASERDAIVQAAVEHATTTIDANLAHINALLGNSDSPTQAEPPAVKSSTKTKQKKAALESEIEPKGTRKKRILKSAAVFQESPALETVKEKSTVSKASKPSKVASKASKSNGVPSLKAEFKNMDLASAIPIVFNQDPDRLFSVDNVIEALYGSVDEDIMGKSRQRIGVSLGHSLKREEIIRIQDKPAIYQLNA